MDDLLCGHIVEQNLPVRQIRLDRIGSHSNKNRLTNEIAHENSRIATKVIYANQQARNVCDWERFWRDKNIASENHCKRKSEIYESLQKHVDVTPIMRRRFSLVWLLTKK